MKIPLSLDYNLASSWFAIPMEDPNIEQNKFDTSYFVSNLPQCDVFFIHGTVLENEGKIYLDPSNSDHRILPTYSNLSQVSCFRNVGRIFQPHYRQLSMEAFINTGEFTYNSYFELPMADIISAYNAYMVNWNVGRPVIIAAHGQGSVLALNLLKHLNATDRKFDKLVAAYLIGCTVTIQDLIDCNLPLSAKFDDICCIITYNCLAQGTDQGLMLFPDALCTNPLNWCNNLKNQRGKIDSCTMSGFADKSLHFGKVDINIDGTGDETPNFSDAWIDIHTGGLILGAYTKDNSPLDKYFPRGDLHLHNYSLFYRNLEKNCLQRIKAFNSRKQYLFYKNQLRKSEDSSTL